VGERNLHFHDLRGTAATKFYTLRLPNRVIAEIMGWAEDEVENIIRSYVDRTAVTKAMIAQINADVKQAVKPGQNPVDDGVPNPLKRLLERVKGIEPSYSAWEAAALPLSYTRLADLQIQQFANHVKCGFAAEGYTRKCLESLRPCA
jgi:hypothetical protein